MKILVVDDMLSMRKVMMKMLRSLGHNNLDEATNGLEALQKLRTQDFDLLITDLHMPNLDGKQLLEKVRHDNKLADLPVLMVSCEDNKTKITELVAAKVTGFIVKPFNTHILRQHIDWIKEEVHIV
ncbi:MAG: response regulator [Colwellia sp.]|nr:response regulator [Colwellia sp.]